MTSSNSSDAVTRIARAAVLLFGVAALGNALGLWDAHAALVHLPTLCAFHWITGHDCPGCGMGRALALLAGGHLTASLHQHPFALPLVLWTTATALMPRAFTRHAHRWAMNDLVPATMAILLIGWWLLLKA